MFHYQFPLTPFVHAKLAGQFSAPSGNWKHISRPLGEYELMLVTEGTLFIAHDTTSYEIHPGEYVIIPPTPHQYGPHASSCVFYWLHFAVEQQREPQKILSVPATGQLPHPSRISVLFSQFCNRIKNSSVTYTTDLFATGLLLELEQQIRKENNFEENAGYALYQKILEYIEWNSGYNINVEQIAHYLGYHPKYLSTVFHRFHPESLKQYLLKCVMEHAKTELSYSSRKVSEIAEEMGFSDVHHFSSAFRRVVGVSPSQYRRTFPAVEPNLW